MHRFITIILLAVSIFSSPAIAKNNTPDIILPDALTWVMPPNLHGVQAAWIRGTEQKKRFYILRVKLASGARINPHTHPDERNITVLSGTIYAGLGEVFDELKVVAIPSGAVYVVPANVPHYVWAKKEDAVYQEVGMGPTGTSFTIFMDKDRP